MSSPSDLNQYYQEWLEIPAERLPPNHYALLGIEDYESNADVIEQAAKSRGAYLHQLAAGPERKTVQQLLSQVAVAKRTLLSDDLRLAYDQELRSPSTDNAAPLGSTSEASEGDMTESDDPQTSGSPNGESPTPYRRRKPSQWPLHAASASVLLAIVGIVYWVNRDPGGRRAAEVNPQASEYATTDSPPSPTATEANDTANGSTRARLAPAKTVASDDRPRKRKSPVVARRETGSGLGSALGSKFGNILDDIESQSSQAAEGLKSDDDEFEPLAGLLIGKVKKSVPMKLWPTNFTKIDAFPQAIAKRFDTAPDENAYRATEQGLVFNAPASKGPIEWVDEQQTLGLGEAWLVGVSLAKEPNANCSVAIAIDGVQLGVRSTKNGVEVFAKDRTEDSKRNSVTKFKADVKDATLIVARDPKSVDRLRWMAKVAKQIHAGTVDATALTDKATVSLVIHAPEKDDAGTLRITDLQTGTLGGK